MKMLKLGAVGVVAMMLVVMFSSVAVADEPIAGTDLAVVNVKGGLLGVRYGVKNVGDVAAENVVMSIHVKGGLLGGIDLEHLCDGSCGNCSTTLLPDQIKNESSLEGGLIVGVGPVHIQIVADASNANRVTVDAFGFALGPLMMVF